MTWTNTSLTNGFSSFAVSQGRAFTLISRNIGGMKEVCVALDAATGSQLWATVIDTAPWSYTSTGDGGSGTSPYNTGDGPRTTPSVQDGRVYALSSKNLHLVCMNATNGSVIWSNDLQVTYGATTPNAGWDNGASPRLDSDLIFVNLNTASSGLTICAFRTTNGSLAWSSQNESSTQSTPVVATIESVRQVIFATGTGLVSLDRSTGAFLWKYTYPFLPEPTSIGASPAVYSNIVYCTASYSRGAAAARITRPGGTWTVTQIFYKTGANYRSIWMTPVCYQGYLYVQSGDNGAFVTQPLCCIELATGNLMWSTNGFGHGGAILVDNTILTLTEDGQLVLVQPNPSAYTELARYRAFSFSAGSPGKCWNSPAVADGFIYARSTRGGVKINVSVPPLKLLSPERFPANQLRLWVGTTTGGAVDTNRLAKMEIRYTTNLANALATWTKLPNSLVPTNGLVRVDNVDASTPVRRYFVAVEQP